MFSPQDEITQLTAEVSRLSSLVEYLMARAAVNLPGGAQLLEVTAQGSFGYPLDWAGSAWSQVTGSPLPVVNPGGALVRWCPPRQSWEFLLSDSLGVLVDDLDYATTAGARVQQWGGPWGAEVPVGAPVKVGEWMLRPGESIPAGTQVVYGPANGQLYVKNAQCYVPGS